MQLTLFEFENSGKIILKYVLTGSTTECQNQWLQQTMTCFLGIGTHHHGCTSILSLLGSLLTPHHRNSFQGIKKVKQKKIKGKKKKGKILQIFADIMD